MKRYFNQYLGIGIGCIGVFILLLILLFFADCQEIRGNVIGLASFNKLFLVKRYVDSWDSLSDVILLFGLGFGAGMAVYGLVQLISRRNLLKMDKDILIMGSSIVILLILWILFDKGLKINFRPLPNQQSKEASFPSTHVMLSSYLLLASCRLILKRNTHTLKHSIIAYGAMTILIVLCALGRILSCMHWMTDVLGGLCIGLGVFMIGIGLDKIFTTKKEEGKE
ncbi:MAG: phosphatase PAP2 family protein [Anaeroplasmataceae bacterium]|nr:phosphatase PAP2 family protein [Anaeroplasmataceae bacterium]